MFRILRWAALIVVCVAFLPVDAIAQRRVCKADLELDLSGRGYRLREARDNPKLDRCEGLYVKQYAGPPPLELMSLVRSPDNASLARDLVLEWQVPPDIGHLWGDSLALEARSTRVVGRPYLMDAAPPLTAQKFDWPVDNMRPETFKREEVAVLAWVRNTTGNGKIHIPLRVVPAVGTTTLRPAASGYIAEFRPNFKVLEATLTVEPVDPACEPSCKSLRKQSKAEHEAGKPFRLEFGDPGPSGLYQVALTAKGAGRPANSEFLFWHDKPKPQ